MDKLMTLATDPEYEVGRSFMCCMFKTVFHHLVCEWPTWSANPPSLDKKTTDK